MDTSGLVVREKVSLLALVANDVLTDVGSNQLAILYELQRDVYLLLPKTVLGTHSELICVVGEEIAIVALSAPDFVEDLIVVNVNDVGLVERVLGRQEGLVGTAKRDRDFGALSTEVFVALLAKSAGSSGVCEEAVQTGALNAVEVHFQSIALSVVPNSAVLAILAQVEPARILTILLSLTFDHLHCQPRNTGVLRHIACLTSHTKHS